MRITRLLVITIFSLVVLTGGAAAEGMIGKIGLTPQVGLVMPIQALQSTEGGGSAKMGFAGGATAEYFVTEDIAVGGRFVFNSFGLDIENVDGDWTILEMGVFAKYFLPVEMPVKPFVRGGILMGKAKATQGDNECDYAMSPGVEIAGGMIHEVAENISVYGEIGWTAVATDGADVDETWNGHTSTVESQWHLQWVGIKAGATFFFGGKE